MRVLKQIYNAKIRAVHAAIAAGVFVAGGLTSAAVIAAIPDANGTIQGCYRTSNGLLRVIDSATDTCGSNENAISWSQSGGGGAGGAKAYAHVLISTDGNGDKVATLDTANSFNIAGVGATSPSQGNDEISCVNFTSAVTNPHGVQATNGSGASGESGSVYSTRLVSDTAVSLGCGSGPGVVVNQFDGSRGDYYLYVY